MLRHHCPQQRTAFWGLICIFLTQSHLDLAVINIEAERETDFIVQCQHAYWKSNSPAHRFNTNRIESLSHHLVGLVDLGTNGPRCVKTDTIVHYDRDLFNLPGEIKCPRQCLIGGMFTDYDFKERHLLDRREEMQPDKIQRFFRFGTQSRNRQGRGI